MYITKKKKINEKNMKIIIFIQLFSISVKKKTSIWSINIVLLDLKYYPSQYSFTMFLQSYVLYTEHTALYICIYKKN